MSFDYDLCMPETNRLTKEREKEGEQEIETVLESIDQISLEFHRLFIRSKTSSMAPALKVQLKKGTVPVNILFFSVLYLHFI